jgi:hypothetical protein
MSAAPSSPVLTNEEAREYCRCPEKMWPRFTQQFKLKPLPISGAYLVEELEQAIRMQRFVRDLLPDQAPKPDLTVNGYVYFVQMGDDGPIKIGFATDVQARITTLQTSSPHELVLRKVVPGTVAKEREFHQRFAQTRLKGEWFKPSSALSEVIGQEKGG